MIVLSPPRALNMVDTQTLDLTLSDLLFDTAKRGSDAYYWHIAGTEWGVKFFCTEKERDINYKRQWAGIELGIAPQLGDKVECIIEGEMMFGFITEHVTTFRKALFDHYSLPENWRECEPCHLDFWQQVNDGIEDVPPHLNELEAQLLEKIEKFPREVKNRILYDFHDGNWGFTKNNVPVILDFSRQGRTSDY